MTSDRVDALADVVRDPDLRDRAGSRSPDRRRPRRPPPSTSTRATGPRPRRGSGRPRAAASTSRPCRASRSVDSARTTASAKLMPFSGPPTSKTRPPAKRHALRRDLELRRRRRDEHLLRALGRLDRGVAGHERHARRVGAEVHRRQVGVARDDADVEGIDAQDLRHDRREDRVGALADVGRAAEDGHAAAAVELQLDARLRHRVPVDRQARAAEVGRAGEAQAAARAAACRAASSSPRPRRPCRCTRRGRSSRRGGSSP